MVFKNNQRGVMLGPIGSNIMAIFRLLSPDEIDRYIVREDIHEVSESLPMASGGESFSSTQDQFTGSGTNKSKDFPKDNQAKILPLHKSIDHLEVRKSTDPHQTDTPLESEANSTTCSLEALGILSAKNIIEIERERLKKENSNKDSATVFLLKEREKLNASKRRMIKQIAFKSYQSNAEQEFYENTGPKDLEEEESHSQKGILLNKKNY